MSMTFDPIPELGEALRHAWDTGGQRVLETELLALIPLCLQEMDGPVLTVRLVEMLGVKDDRTLCRRVYTVLAYQAAEKLSGYCYEQAGERTFTRWWIMPKEADHE